MLLYKNVTFFYLDLSEKDLLLQLLLQGNLQNRADLRWRWPLRTRQSPKHVFSGFGQQRFQVSRERTGTSPSHPCSPVAAESHSHDQVTNSTPQQPACLGAKPAQSTMAKTEQHFPTVWRPTSSYGNQKGGRTTLWRRKLRPRYLLRPRLEPPRSGRLPCRRLPRGRSCAALSWSEHWEHLGHFLVLLLVLPGKSKDIRRVSTL